MQRISDEDLFFMLRLMFAKEHGWIAAERTWHDENLYKIRQDEPERWNDMLLQLIAFLYKHARSQLGSGMK